MNYDPVISHEHDWNVYPEFDSNNEMPAILFVPEYNWMDRINAFRGFLDTNGTLYPQIQALDFRQDVTRLEVPYYMVLGEHEARGRAVLANEWFDMLGAPAKEAVVFDGGGHRAHFDQPGMFADLMDRILDDINGSDCRSGSVSTEQAVACSLFRRFNHSSDQIDDTWHPHRDYWATGKNHQPD